jgi:hypothetical protein
MRMAGITGSPGLCLMRYSTVNVRPQRGHRDGLNGRKERKARPVHPGCPAGWMVLRCSVKESTCQCARQSNP